MTATSWSPTDSAYQARLLRAHEDLRAITSPHAEDGLVREAVLASWRRSLEALPGPDAAARAAIEGEELAEVRRHHVFADLLPLLRSRLIDPAVEAGLMVALGDARGRLLWVEGRPQMISRADDMGFAVGADWSEPAMGTSAPALALATSSSMQVVGAEHFHEAVHPWSCSAVPVLHPHTRETLGVLDVTGSAEAVAPLVLPLLEATARAVQDELRTRLGAAPPPGAEQTRAAPARRTRILPRAAAELLLTGRRTPQLRQGDRTIELSGRHAELLALLHLSADGITGAELAERLHGTASAEGTVRAEVVRLRKVLAAVDGLEIASRPYRLLGDLDSDLLRTRSALAHGDLDAALSHGGGDLLPGSSAPEIEDLRRSTGSHLRELLLERGSWRQLWRFAQRPEADGDLDILMAVLELAPPDAPERAAAVVRAQELRGEVA
ncbi:helix-turn-helix domain-containing protein [Brachybacterium sp. AOP43-C2-M15]|uniref:helix-turn-helix domain-containing protein n=1 Tax=Brachybacterium sp. AOP43-C2-M15 TaxID=3457661 RepID=UPI004033F4A4